MFRSINMPNVNIIYSGITLQTGPLGNSALLVDRLISEYLHTGRIRISYIMAKHCLTVVEHWMTTIAHCAH